ncbi:DsbA family oxidoreductase [Fusibacter sp. 3D3]|uniref:DsbA family oxidoreductase n=1 Tax=Fusibacter sp. 3D3 TaxID=1048380 RepID=UPI000853BCAD|nr:DsbA family oxidoreductase [Fusibacter sp. 3D3]GAU79135.1 2-hydroxychromene-2-carboxylate isomerase/DsbA-like thioredoxin domain [Fusibacter sp. 3D3]
MKIEVWSDYVCPFCYIGKRRMEEALNQLDFKSEITVEFKSFELDPNAPKAYDANIHELIAKKYGIPVRQAKASNEQIVAQAKGMGLNYDFDAMKPTNTFDAHRLAHYAHAEGKQDKLSERLLSAYFTEGKDLSDHEVLAVLAKEVGLDYYKVIKVLGSDQYKNEVRKDESDARKLNISGVPYFVINGNYAISGAQPTDVFLQRLNKIKTDEIKSKLEETHASSDASAGICVDGQCKI